ncbi:hypothetical protein GCK72_000596 [Caenorhabditis remanei]|uniref:Rho-GAP domain-containing protein n=1 Tax=Caenorhabditis remanei TaxID=31234 RepID=A0A6A5HRA1_CAERE|nr:hypothetical protein GCK72_000596 [Caenorhabditis remanei]KAF1768783.1 hypothetical protein GCK72_000596 [Caenorhabditis remanei]
MATTTFYTKQRCNWIEGRDAKVDEVMREWMHKFCSFQDVKICVSTFNVNGKSPQSVFPTWFSQKREDVAEFYAVGLQEMDLSVGTYIIDNTKKMEGWTDAIHSSLPGGRTHFNVIGSMRLVGIFVIVFQSVHSKVRVTDINVKYVATGISVLVNKLGNKGGTAISMKMNDTWVCFVNAHFAAGNNELERRNQDFRDIYNDVVFYPRSQQEGLRDRPLEVPVMCLYDHDVVFWFGDLNYRLNTDGKMSNEDVRRIASSEKFADLLQYCQLREQMTHGTVFKDFKEPDSLPFRPTYKYDCGTNTWDTSEKGRVPAWTDRILTFTKHSKVGLELIQPMESVETITISDHKPVRALFNLKVKKINESGANSVYEEAIREADRRANEELPQVQLSLNEVDFGIVNYLEPKTRSVIVQNVGKSKVRFSFKVRPNARNNQEICEKWLMVTPTHYQIPQGSSMEISLTVSISTDIVRRIQDVLRNGQLQEILVLHLENGRDYFIPVTAVYNNSCFGSTLEKLLTARPKKEVNLIDFDDFSDNLASDNCPPYVPRVVYRLVMALRVRGAAQLNIEEELDNAVFNRIRSALETGNPDDMSTIASSYMLYSALIRLLDSLDEPVIMEGMFKIIHKEMIKYRTDARQLWTTVRLSLPKPNQAVLELVCLMLREFFSQKYELRDQLSLWAGALFRHDITEERMNGMYATVLQTMCDYAPDVALG